MNNSTKNSTNYNFKITDSLGFGIGGMSFSAGEFTLQGIGLAGVLGVLMNLFLPGKSRTNSEQIK